MVFKPFTHLARQTFSKAFAHGYAQSVVAASQSSFVSTTPLNHLPAAHPGKFSRTTQLQNAFQHTSSGSSGAGAKAGHGASGTVSGDPGLAAYFAAWQHAQQTGDDSDWRQFQFRKRIGWKPTAEEGEEGDQAKGLSSTESDSSQGLRDRTASNEASDSRSVESAPVNSDVSAKVEEAVAREIEQIQNAEEDVDTVTGSSVAPSDESAAADGLSAATEWTPTSSVQESSESAVADQAWSDKVRESSDRVVQLAKSGSYSQIPAVFESVLKEGVTPTADAYNALLDSAVHLHSDVRHSAPKALDVYSDMLRRGVMPNEGTYKTLIQVLATRAVDSLQMMQNLEQQRVRFGGMEDPDKFIFRSSEVEHELLKEDHSLPIALKLFTVATSKYSGIDFSSGLYRTLLTACALQGDVEETIRIFSHMESQKVAPHAALFPPMIDAFASTGDLNSAVECYNEYKSLAIADDKGVFGIVERKDGEVYAALIKAYITCGKKDGGNVFFDKIKSSFEGVENGEIRLRATEELIVTNGWVQHSLDSGKFSEALRAAKSDLQGTNLTAALSKICVAAADAGHAAAASESYDLLSTGTSTLSTTPVVAMLALHIRQGSLSVAKPLWSELASNGHASRDLIQPTAMYAAALLKSGNIAEGLSEARTMFARIRTAAADQVVNVREEVDEAVDLLGRVVIDSAAVLPPQAAMTLLWTMVENGGLVSPVAEHAIASLGPMGINNLSAQDLTLALQVQAGMLVNGSSSHFDAAHPVRFAHMLEVALSTGLPLDLHTSQLLEQGLAKLGGSRPDLVQKWHHQNQTPPTKPAYVAPRYTPAPEASPALKQQPSSSRPEESYDPHAQSTDYRGSSIIADELESTGGRAEDHLDKALTRFRNMRRIGRHPRYITYAKLITAAAKCGRMSLAHEILGTARHDVPLLPQYGAVKYGWTSIFDAMVAACLTSGDRGLAAKYHQELLGIGAAPSANTFGLYITTLKESTKTFDEATEAVKIFHRATAEGVEPTSFLYNALIGKLGKARRIDDCLQYFAEMRANGVKPTSVTYGTVVNALCRVSDERFAEEMFDEMESMPNYKPRPAPYNSLIQYFLNTKRDRSKVLAYYERMRSKNIQPTMHTYKLLIDAYASLEPVNMEAAEGILHTIKSSGQHPQAVHYASLIHAKGCVQNDMDGARKIFDSVVSAGKTRPQPCLYQALFEAMVANHQVSSTPDLLKNMVKRNVEMTPYIANTLIHGWAADGSISNSKSIYDGIGIQKREPSTYEAMTRAFLAAEDRRSASDVVQEMLSRGYPSAVSGKLLELVGGGGGSSSAASVA